MYFETTYMSDSRDMDRFNLCRPSALLGYLQDAAGQAAMAFQASTYEMAEKYGCFWMLARWHYTLDRPIRLGDALTVKTWHRGGEKTVMYRDFDLTVNGEKAGEAISSWVLAEIESRSLCRLDRFPEFAGTDGGELIRRTKVPHLTMPGTLTLRERRLLRYSDTDLNGHVNNTRYGDFMCDALNLETAPPGTFVRELQIGYVKECRPGETLELWAGEDGGRAWVQGSDTGGEVRFRGMVYLGKNEA